MKMLERIKDLLKNNGFFNNKNKSNEEIKKERFFNQTILPFIKFGDIIFAERFITETEKQNMGEGHITGPFVVVGVDNDRIIGCYCTSREDRPGNFAIGEKYDLFDREKLTFTTRKRIQTIDYISFINKHDRRLNDEDRNRLLKMLLINPNTTYNDFGLEKKLELDEKVSLEPRDIIYYKSKPYLILDEKDNNYICVELKNYNPHVSRMILVKESYDITKLVMVPKNINNYVNTLSKNQFEIILEDYKKQVERKELISSNTIDRGTVIKVANSYYYVYGINGNVADVFLLEKAYKGVENCISIGKYYFVPNFNSYKKIQIKNDQYTVLMAANDEEMTTIKNMKKSHNKTKKEEIKRGTRVDYNIGEVVALTSNKNSRYIIVSIDDRNIHTVSFDSLLFSENIICMDFIVGIDKLKKCDTNSIEMNIVKSKIEKYYNTNNIGERTIK